MKTDTTGLLKRYLYYKDDNKKEILEITYSENINNLGRDAMPVIIWWVKCTVKSKESCEYGNQ